MFPAALDTMLPMNSEPLIVEQDEQGILRLRGPLTMENLASFQSALRRGNAPILFLDLSEVPYMDSAGLGSLVSAHVSVQKSGRRVVLTGVNERIGKLFEITRVESLFLTFPSLPDAFDALLKSGRA
jgi:anti-sigma B factor antagonist